MSFSIEFSVRLKALVGNVLGGEGKPSTTSEQVDVAIRSYIAIQVVNDIQDHPNISH